VPKVKQEVSINSLRHTEYYGMQQTYDDLYAKSKNGEPFSALMDVILSRENILLAYRNIKANTGSDTPGTDRLTIKDIGRLSTEQVVGKVRQIHENLRINVSLMLKLMRQPTFGYDVEYADNRISLFCAQWGKCAITGREFHTPNEIHCHHKKPRDWGGGDKYANLILVLEPVHKLIHARETDIILQYLSLLNLDQNQLQNLNKLRTLAGLPEITQL